MKIIEALQTENIRISNGNKWMYYDVNFNVWIVREHVYGQKGSFALTETSDEEEAIKMLLS